MEGKGGGGTLQSCRYVDRVMMGLFGVIFEMGASKGAGGRVYMRIYIMYTSTNVSIAFLPAIPHNETK